MSPNCNITKSCHTIAWRVQDTTAANTAYKYNSTTNLLCSRSLDGAVLLASPACHKPAQDAEMHDSSIQDGLQAVHSGGRQCTAEAACTPHADVHVMHAPERKPVAQS